MGHDISAFNKERDGAEVAYLRRGAFDDLNMTIYTALGAEEHCGSNRWSGLGMKAYFSRERIKSALDSLPASGEVDRERQFLADCLKTDSAGVWIVFA